MKRLLCKIVQFLLVFNPLLEPYMIGGVTLDTLSMFFSICIALTFSLKRFKFGYGSGLFFMYALIVPNILAISYGYFDHLPSSLIVLISYIVYQTRVFPILSINFVLKCYRILIYISCTVFIIQEFMYATEGYRFVTLFPYLDVRYNGLTMSNFISSQMYYPRSSAFFLEPSHMAQYILPYLAVSLGVNHTGLSLKNYCEPIMLTVVLFFLRSGCGIVGATIIWTFYVIHVDLSIVKKILFLTVSCIIILVLFEKLAFTETGMSLIDRSTELETGGDYERSGTIRIFRGFFVYGAMDYLQQMLGVGTGGSIDIIEHSRYYMMFFGNERYLNNIQMLLIGYGFVGTILFANHCRRLYQGNALSGKLVLVAFLSMCFLECFFMTSKMIIYFSLVFLLRDSQKANNAVSNHLKHRAFNKHGCVETARCYHNA